MSDLIPDENKLLLRKETKILTARYERPCALTRYINKYYLSPDDREKLFPADLEALEILQRHAQFLESGVISESLPNVTMYYKDLNLKKELPSDLVRRGLTAILSYWEDRHAEPTPEELRAAINLNEWLRSYEKVLLEKQLSLVQQLNKGLGGDDPFLVDYAISLKLDFYVREDDPFFENEEASRYDEDFDTSLMCTLDIWCDRHLKEKISNSDYYGLGDDQDHNDMRAFSDHPIYQARHCMLFHELTSHYGVPVKHLIRIGTIWANFEVIYQNAMGIDLTGEQIVIRQSHLAS